MFSFFKNCCVPCSTDPDDETFEHHLNVQTAVPVGPPRRLALALRESLQAKMLEYQQIVGRPDGNTDFYCPRSAMKQPPSDHPPLQRPTPTVRPRKADMFLRSNMLRNHEPDRIRRQTRQLQSSQDAEELRLRALAMEPWDEEMLDKKPSKATSSSMPDLIGKETLI